MKAFVQRGSVTSVVFLSDDQMIFVDSNPKLQLYLMSLLQLQSHAYHIAEPQNDPEQRHFIPKGLLEDTRRYIYRSEIDICRTGMSTGI